MKFKSLARYLPIFFLVQFFLSLTVWAAPDLPQADIYLPSTNDMIKAKAIFDDNKDLFVTYHPKDILPPEIWETITYDIDKMKAAWKDLVGFTAPELVGKIAPEIKPGKYTYKDLDKYPGIKKLFPEVILKTIKAGGPPHVGNIMDFEIEPTTQMFASLPAAEVTKRNLGKTKLDQDGYIVAGTWEGGIPFPRPSGQFKAQQVYYNFEKKFILYDECHLLTGEAVGFDKNLVIDKYSKYAKTQIKLMGRTFFPPFGWFDERAKKRGEFSSDAIEILEPRANRGLVTMLLRYDDPNKMDPTMIYLPQLRRIRKMSSTDTQDPLGDSTYDDTAFLRQKISPLRFPYKFEITEEREYLLPWCNNSGKAWYDSKNGYAIRDLVCQRRPCYVLQMTQMDPNYTYSKRIYCIDKETFQAAWGEFYDQKGRLYRTYNVSHNFVPECGQLVSYGVPAWQVDYIDLHSTCQILTLLPANFARRDFNMENLIRKGK